MLLYVIVAVELKNSTVAVFGLLLKLKEMIRKVAQDVNIAPSYTAAKRKMNLKT